MSIADEITRIQAAKSDLKTAIENKGVEVGDGTIDTYAEKIGEISGGSGVNPLDYAVTMPSFTYVDFADNPDLVVEIPNFDGKDISAKFGYTSNLQSVTLICNVRNVAMQTTTAFYNSRRLKAIDLSEFNTTFLSATSTFGSCVSLERIIGTLDFSNVASFNNTFGQCNNLQEIRVAPNRIKATMDISASNVLSKESITSIIDGLSDTISGLSVTLSKSAVNTAFETDENLADGSVSDEWIALITSKSNEYDGTWTISLL